MTSKKKIHLSRSTIGLKLLANYKTIVMTRAS